LARHQGKGLQQGFGVHAAQHNRWHGTRAKVLSKGSGCMQHSTTVGKAPGRRFAARVRGACSTAQPLVRRQIKGLQQGFGVHAAQHNRWQGARSKVCSKGSGCMQHSTTVGTASE
jgi:hypothetical protein